MTKSFFRNMRSGTYFSMIGGTLLSSGIGAYINVVGSTELPRGVVFLVIGALCLSASGIAIFAASNQLESILTPIHGAPAMVKPQELEAMWDESFRHHGTALTVTFGCGVVLGIIGAALLTYRLALI